MSMLVLFLLVTGATCERYDDMTVEYLLPSLLGPSARHLLREMDALSVARPSLMSDIDQLRSDLNRFCLHSMKKLSDNLVIKSLPDDVLSGFNGRGQPLRIITAELAFGYNGHRIRVESILQSFIFNNVLVIPKEYSLYDIFGDTSPSRDGPLVLRIQALTASGNTYISVTAPKGYLLEDLVISNALPAVPRHFNLSTFQDISARHIIGKRGIEVGGPSELFSDGMIYAHAMVDIAMLDAGGIVLNIEADLSDGAPNPVPGSVGGSITHQDGATLPGILNEEYDFYMSSHVLEHFLNPIRALKTAKRVVKPGGIILLVVPWKERCFDHYRDNSRLEDIIYRYLRKAEDYDVNFSNRQEIFLQTDRQFFNKSKKVLLHEDTMRSITDPRSDHQFVYDYELIEKMASLIDLDVILTGNLQDSMHQCIVLQKKNGTIQL
eukprot:CAMPEP_0185033246 /NCGR_PEP_ID=MMETSP1103-20130426/22017_1 /TAXON_ID=36769 /ORGANISM="Paraphysomonas bandaiensis, Strain Caron Lab Isolate" /LENGTH=435 /DNA_ID=CAMNT_0027569451 /DNA_START=85 /DNA_END=1392 /DNA_ORIENTATION=+